MMSIGSPDYAINFLPLTPGRNTMKVLSDFVLRLLTRSTMARWSPIPLRLIVGYGFMQHGFAKLSKGPDMFAAILQGLRVPPPPLMPRLTIPTTPPSPVA